MQKKVSAGHGELFLRERFQIHNSKQHLLLKCNFKLHLKLCLNYLRGESSTSGKMLTEVFRSDIKGGFTGTSPLILN